LYGLEAYNPQKLPMSVEIINSTDEENEYDATLKNVTLYKKLYNLSDMPYGDYTIEVKMGNEVFVKEIKFDKSATELLKESKYFEPVFQDGDNSVELTVLNPKKDKVSVSFWKESDKFFEDKQINPGSFRRNYNLKKLEPGEYQVDVEIGEKNYPHSIIVR
jgi:hypothetical protein